MPRDRAWTGPDAAGSGGRHLKGYFSAYTADCQFIEALGFRDRELAFSGTAVDRIEDAIDATFNGEVVLRTWAGQSPIAACQAPDHRLEFTR